MTELLEVTDLSKSFYIKNNKRLLGKKLELKAVKNVSFHIVEGETLGVIGESGCGKSTLSRLLMHLITPTSGTITYKGNAVTKKNIKNYRKDVQMVFQDPFSSLDPRMNVKRIIEEPLRIHTTFSTKEKTEISKETIEKVGLKIDSLQKYPHEFSGGQLQRISIARSLMLNPEFLILDEPVSALDMSVQAQILNLLEETQEMYHLTYLFISHDMSVIRHISDRILVMYLGEIVELAPKKNIFSDTLHPYTKALIDSIPKVDIQKKSKSIANPLKGDLPSPINPPAGCPFQTRCAFAERICTQENPELKELKEGHYVACHIAEREMK